MPDGKQQKKEQKRFDKAKRLSASSLFKDRPVALYPLRHITGNPKLFGPEVRLWEVVT